MNQSNKYYFTDFLKTFINKASERFENIDSVLYQEAKYLSNIEDSELAEDVNLNKVLSLSSSVLKDINNPRVLDVKTISEDNNLYTKLELSFIQLALNGVLSIHAATNYFSNKNNYQVTFNY